MNINPDSLIPQETRLEALQRIMPEIFCEGKIDWEKLKATLGTDIDFSNDRYVLNWAEKAMRSGCYKNRVEKYCAASEEGMGVGIMEKK